MALYRQNRVLKILHSSTMWLLWKYNRPYRCWVSNVFDNTSGDVIKGLCSVLYCISLVRHICVPEVFLCMILRCIVHALAGNHPQFIVYCAASLYGNDYIRTNVVVLFECCIQVTEFLPTCTIMHTLWNPSSYSLNHASIVHLHCGHQQWTYPVYTFVWWLAMTM